MPMVGVIGGLITLSVVFVWISFVVVVLVSVRGFFGCNCTLGYVKLVF